MGGNEKGLVKNESAGKLRRDPNDPPGLSYDKVMAIYEDRAGKLWIGASGGGLNEWDRATGKFSRYQHDPGEPHSLSNNDVRAICEDQTGILWVATNGGGVNKLDREIARAFHPMRSRLFINRLPCRISFGLEPPVAA